MSVFFFKQKTAYEIGLGIPAEPLFRSVQLLQWNSHIKFNLTIPLQQLNGLETLVIIMVANKYAFLQITRKIGRASCRETVPTFGGNVSESKTIDAYLHAQPQQHGHA